MHKNESYSDVSMRHGSNTLSRTRKFIRIIIQLYVFFSHITIFFLRDAIPLGCEWKRERKRQGQRNQDQNGL